LFIQILPVYSVVDDDAAAADAGSPFQFTVGPVKNGGAHKVVAVGDGLQSANTSQPGISCSQITAQQGRF